MTEQRRRIWGWMLFDWAQQPYATLGLTFIFGPYFAATAAQYFMGLGTAEADADAQAQALWSAGQTIAGLFVAFTAPFLGAWADASGRKVGWIGFFAVIYCVCFWSLWWLMPDGTGLYFTLIMFWIGFVAAESALNVNNAILPSLGDDRTIGRISGSAAAFGYWGGVLALVIMLLLFDDGAGKTLIGLQPGLGMLDADQREGTRAVGPFIAIWGALFIIPFFLWTRDDVVRSQRPSAAQVMGNLRETVTAVFQRKSLGNFLLSSMLYRDALNAVYSFGGIYAALVLGWQTIQIGVFGIVAAIAAAILTWVGGIYDQKLGPKPVIVVSCWVLVAVSTIIVGMSRESLFGVPLAPGSMVPDIVFYVCGALLGGAGGASYSASRTMMVRHSHPDRPGEAFGLFALTGKATAFLAPALITTFTLATGSNQLGFLPVIALFLIGLFLLRFVNKDGDRALWSVTSSPSP
jgi:UMF1 family MFS transporter